MAATLAANRGHTLPFTGDAGLTVGHLLASGEIFRFALLVVVVTSVSILVIQVEEFMGRRFFMGFCWAGMTSPARRNGGAQH
ncbi:MAG: hypothetical protein IPI95_13185 [Flavobacteriales bacterium]|nr:hypothetical protein [Flavobacteriales bacterium]